MHTYNKLVRDRIPEIGKANGEVHHIHIASDTEFYEKLKEKLQEEVDEYLETGEISEIADILEILHTLCDHHGLTFNDIETIRVHKKHERGGFEKRIILEYVE